MMALNENSRMLPLLRILNNVKNEAEELCVQAIRNILKISLVTIPIQLIGIILGRSWFLIFPFIIYIVFCAYVIFHIIPYQFNLQEMRNAIDGDTFKILEVNTELVITWISRANQVIGRAKLVSVLFPLFSIMITFIMIYSSFIL